MGRKINQFRRHCLPSTLSWSSVEDSEPTYISINSLSVNEGNDVLDEPSDDADAIINDDEDNLVWEINLNADNYRVCITKAAHNAVMGKIDTSLAKKSLTTTEAPHLYTKSLNPKLDDVAKTVILMSPRSCPNKSKNLFFVLVDAGYVNDLHPKQSQPKFNSSKPLFDIAKISTDS